MRPISRALAAQTALLLLAMPLFSNTDDRPSSLGVTEGRLSPCPSSPNCVSSDAADEEHRIAPFQLTVDPDDAWRTARELVARLPRTRIVSETDDYLHVECRSALFRFVDDLELHLRPSETIIAVRSASRTGTSDLGVNRRRVEELRAELVDRGVLLGDR